VIIVRKRKALTLFAAGIGFLLLAAQGWAQFPVWTNYFGGKTIVSEYNGLTAPVGSVVDVYFDVEGEMILVGTDTISTLSFGPGYGFIGVTDDAGITTDDPLVFELNGRPTTILGPDEATFGAMGENKEVNLAAEGIVQAEFTGPTGQIASPNQIITYSVLVKNTGNGIDFFKVVSAVSSNGWLTDFSDNFTYLRAGETGHVDFTLWVPISALSGSDQIEFEIASGIDHSVSYAGSVVTLISPTDIEDEDPTLPSGFILYQNYPNPFNPATTVTFNLPTAASATLEIFNLLGEKVEAIDLGRRAAGTHCINISGASLASGIYLYRLKADGFSAVRKMTLLK